MSEVEKPVDADAVSNALRLGWQIAELRGRFWRRINSLDPVHHQIVALTREDFAAFVFAWDARVQDQLAAVSYSQCSAYQLGRGLAEVSWQLDAGVSAADDPHGWQFLLGEARLRQLGRLMDGLSSYFGPMTVAAVKNSV